MACRTVAGTTPGQRSFIDQYDALTGAIIKSTALPFTMTNDGQGYDMAYSNGFIYVMAGRSGATQGTLFCGLFPSPQPWPFLAWARSL